MYFRVKKTPSGKVIQLLESYRDSEGHPKHRVVVSLGNATIPEGVRKEVAKGVEYYLHGQESLLEAGSPAAAEWIDSISKRIDRAGNWKPLRQYLQEKTSSEVIPEATDEEPGSIDGVILDKVSHTYGSSLGPELLGLSVWNTLKLPELLDRLGFNDAQKKAAAVSVINRLCAPCSEHALIPWLEVSSLVEILGEETILGGDDRYYRVSDKLYRNRKQIEAHLREKTALAFRLERTILLYDLTNTYFEGSCQENPKAKRGKSKHRRNDCPQVVLGMVFDEYGFSLAHRTFEGNKNDSKTLVDMVKSMQEITQEDESLLKAKPVVVVDAGIATQANLALLREDGFSYLVNDSRRKRSAHRDEFMKLDGFRKIEGRDKKPAVHVKLIRREIETASEDKSQEGDAVEEILVLCKSGARREKEYAIVSKCEEHYLDELEKLKSRIEKGNIKDNTKIERAIGRLGQKYSRAAIFYAVSYTPPEADSTCAGILAWLRDDEKHQQADDLFGCYVLRTDCPELDAEKIWTIYMTLTRAEDGFRALKSDLGLRPNFHRIEERVDAHIFITILAYQILSYIQYTLQQKGDHRSWPTLRRILSTHRYATINIPTIDGRLYRTRKPGTPDQSQALIYRSFSVDLKNLPKFTVALPAG